MDNDRKEMTDAQLEEIASIVRHFSVSNPWLSAKIKDLIAEVERLRAENAAFARLEKWLKDHPKLRFVETDYCDKYRMLFVENDDGDAGPQTGTGEGPTLAAAINAALDAAGAPK